MLEDSSEGAGDVGQAAGTVIPIGPGITREAGGEPRSPNVRTTAVESVSPCNASATSGDFQYRMLHSPLVAVERLLAALRPELAMRKPTAKGTPDPHDVNLKAPPSGTQPGA